MKIQRVERTQITREHPNFKMLDRLCFLSKNLYNTALFRNRQIYIGWLKDENPDKPKLELEWYKELCSLLKSHNDYKAMPAKVSQQTLKLIEKNFKSYFAAKRAYWENPSKFKSEPKIPNYLGKKELGREDGRFVTVYTLQALGSKSLKQGKIKFSRTDFELESKVARLAANNSELYQVNQVRIVPKKGYYVLEVVYTQVINQKQSNKNKIAAGDIGVNNLLVLTFNGKCKPFIINGKPLKAINQHYNKLVALAQSRLPTGMKSSKRIKNLYRRRDNKITHYLHCVTKTIIQKLSRMNVGQLVIGLNTGWKQEVNLGSVNNQNFVQIPFYKFIQQLTYKGEVEGITVTTREESYTSRASALDNDLIPTRDKDDKEKPKPKPKFSGRRVKRGYYQSKNRTRINADVNGSFNILRKHLSETGVSKLTKRMVEKCRDYLLKPRTLKVSFG